MYVCIKFSKHMNNGFILNHKIMSMIQLSLYWCLHNKQTLTNMHTVYNSDGTRNAEYKFSLISYLALAHVWYCTTDKGTFSWNHCCTNVRLHLKIWFTVVFQELSYPITSSQHNIIKNLRTPDLAPDPLPPYFRVLKYCPSYT